MVRDSLKRLGLKATPQRLAILDLLDGNTSHPSAEQIYQQLKPQYPSLSLATVYNTLETLARNGELQEIRIKPDRRHFDPNPKPHAHFLCRVCEAIFDLTVAPVEINVPFYVKGFRVEEYTPYYFGVCPRCQETARD